MRVCFVNFLKSMQVIMLFSFYFPKHRDITGTQV